MQEREIYAMLSVIFAEVFMRDDLELRAEMSAWDVPGWDSFKQVEIVMTAEQQFGITMSTRELDSLQNVGDLVTVIAEKLQRADR